MRDKCVMSLSWQENSVVLVEIIERFRAWHLGQDLPCPAVSCPAASRRGGRQWATHPQLPDTLLLVEGLRKE